jgi:hypothetical protein
MDQILCQYCREHCDATFRDFTYERTRCLPRISDREQARRRQAAKPTNAPTAHSPTCPSLNEMGIRGSCTLNRHVLTAPANTGDGHRGETTAIQGTTPHKVKAVLTDDRVVSTTTAHGWEGASMARDGHNYISPSHPKTPMVNMRARSGNPDGGEQLMS